MAGRNPQHTFVGALASFCIVLQVVLCVPRPALSEPNDESYASAGDFGGIGLLQTRTARFGEDGRFEFGTTYVDPYRRWYFNVHFLPWLEGTFRYTDIRNRFFSEFPDAEGDQSFKDRGSDIKIRLLEEDRFVPALAVGFQDGLGTGLFQGEYLVGSKRFHDFDISAGLGWGYLANGGKWSNPLTNLSPEFKVRSANTQGGGRLAMSSYFSGEFVSPFFGVEYLTPIEGLTIKAEYEQNDYQREPLGNSFLSESSINYGLSYQPFPWLDVSLAYERGNTVQSKLAIHAGLNDAGLPKFDPPPPQVTMRPRVDVLDAKYPSGEEVQRPLASSTRSDLAAQALVKEFENTALEVSSVELTGNRAIVSLAADDVEPSPRAIERAAAAVADFFPFPVEAVAFVRSDDRDAHVVVDHSDIENIEIVDHLFDEIELNGLSVTSLEFTHEEATIVLQAAAGFPVSDVEREAAASVFKASPVPITKVTVVMTRAGTELERIAYSRDEVWAREATDSFFDLAAASGIEIQSVDVASDRAVIHAVAASHGVRGDPRIASDLAIQSPFDVDEVRVIIAHGISERYTATVVRSSDGWKTAASGVEHVPDAEISMSEEEKDRVAQKFFEALAEIDFIGESLSIEGRKATIYVASRRFRQVARNIGWVARVAASTLPPWVERFTIVSLSGGAEMSRISVWRKDIEDAVSTGGSAEEIWANAEIQPPSGDWTLAGVGNAERYPSLTWGFGPGIRQHIGGVEKFNLYQVWARVKVDLELARGLGFTAIYGRDIYNNFDRIRKRSDSLLPHVRSDIKEYLQQGENALLTLQGDYVFSPASQVYVRASAGLFEEMYGGVSGEVLYRPFNSRIAFGADYNWVKQREFDVLFDFRNYNVGTGHFSVYYQWPWYDILTIGRVGKYLAGDRGGTFEISRRFDSGVRLGAWVTLTNVPYEVFGEGSFDKGVFLSFPFELLLLQSARTSGSLAFRPLTRDGGQRVRINNRLYDMTSEADLGTIMDDWDRFLD